MKLYYFLGHGPFSHMFETRFIHKVKPGTDWKVSLWIFESTSSILGSSLINFIAMSPDRHGFSYKQRIMGLQRIDHFRIKEWIIEGKKEA